MGMLHPPSIDWLQATQDTWWIDGQTWVPCFQFDTSFWVKWFRMFNTSILVGKISHLPTRPRLILANKWVKIWIRPWDRGLACANKRHCIFQEFQFWPTPKCQKHPNMDRSNIHTSRCLFTFMFSPNQLPFLGVGFCRSHGTNSKVINLKSQQAKQRCSPSAHCYTATCSGPHLRLLRKKKWLEVVSCLFSQWENRLAIFGYVMLV